MEKNSGNKIFVYSGTGNSLASAKQIAAALDCEVVHITDELGKSGTHFSGNIGIILYPVYAYGMPMTVKRFIRGNRFSFEYLVCLTTCGSHSKGAFAEAIRLFKRQKARVHYSNEIKSVENYVHMFRLPPDDVLVTQIEKQSEITDTVIESLKQRKTNKRFPIRPLSIVALFVFRRATKTFAKRYKFTPECNGCGLCRRVCPADAIEMVDGNPKIKPKKCDHCQACLQLCPKKAIRFGRIQPNGRRYKHSGITLQDMYKR